MLWVWPTVKQWSSRYRAFFARSFWSSDSPYQPLPRSLTACWVKSKFPIAGTPGSSLPSVSCLWLPTHALHLRQLDLVLFYLCAMFSSLRDFALPLDITNSPIFRACLTHSSSQSRPCLCSALLLWSPVLLSPGVWLGADYSRIRPHPPLWCSVSFSAQSLSEIAHDLYDTVQQGLRPADPLQSCLRSFRLGNPLLQPESPLLCVLKYLVVPMPRLHFILSLHPSCPLHLLVERQLVIFTLSLFRWHLFSEKCFLVSLVELSISYLWTFVLTFNFYWHLSHMFLNAHFCTCLSSQLIISSWSCCAIS